MEEKKLTDEQILTALEKCLSTNGNCTCTNCKFYTGNGYEECIVNVSTSALKFIHRLQAENELLKERNYWLESEHEYQCEKSYFEGVEKGQKDTEKEILQGFMKWLNQAISESYDKSVKGSIHYGGKNRAFHEVKELVKKVAEEKGVEVEL